MESYSMQVHRSVTVLVPVPFPVTNVAQGTRMHIYRWLNSETARDEADSKQLQSLPVLETKSKWTKKIHPGAPNPVKLVRNPTPSHCF